MSEMTESKKAVEENLKVLESVCHQHGGTDVFFCDPCVVCPFAKNHVRLTKTQIEGLLSMVRNGDEYQRECELSSHLDELGPVTVAPEFFQTDPKTFERVPFRACIGYLAFMKKTCKSPRHPTLRAIVRGISAQTLEHTVSYQEFLNKELPEEA